MTTVRGGAALLGVLLAGAAAGCTSGGARSAAPSSPSTTPSPTSAAASPVTGSEQPVLGTSTITCEHSIDGGPPPDGYTVVLGAVALPASPRYPALQAGTDGPDPAAGVFAKAGLVVRAGTGARIEVPTDATLRVGIGWSGWPSAPARSIDVPSCPDARGTGWLAFAGGYWADRPLCLPLTVTAGGRRQTVEVGVGTACAGQSPPPVS
jgi:hypothetical protein